METTTILLIYWTIIGIFPYRLANVGPLRFSRCGAFQPIVMTILFSVFYIRVSLQPYNSLSIYKTPMSTIADFVGGTSESSMIVAIWLSFGLRRKRIRKIQKSFESVVESCEFLGIRGIRSDLMRNVKIQAAIVNVFWFGTYVYTHVTRMTSSDLWIWMPHRLGYVAYPNFIIIYVGVMTTLRHQFSSLNDKLRNTSEIDTSGRAIGESIRRKRSKKSGQVNPNYFYQWMKSLVEIDFLATVERVHAEVVGLTKSVMDFFSPTLYLALLMHLIRISTILYDVCIAFGEQKFFKRGYIDYSIHLCFWFGVHLMEIFSLVAFADATANEANRTRNILHEIVLSKPTKRRNEWAQIWSLRLLHEYVRIEVFGIIEMRYSIMYKICSIGVGYVTMMMQLDDEERPANSTDKAVII